VLSKPWQKQCPEAADHLSLRTGIPAQPPGSQRLRLPPLFGVGLAISRERPISRDWCARFSSFRFIEGWLGRVDGLFDGIAEGFAAGRVEG